MLVNIRLVESRTFVEINAESCQMQCLCLLKNAFGLLFLDRDVILRLLRSRRRASSTLWWSATTRPEFTHTYIVRCIRADMVLISVDYLLRVTLNEHHKQSHVAMCIYLRLFANGCECARVYVFNKVVRLKEWIHRLSYAATVGFCVHILSWFQQVLSNMLISITLLVTHEGWYKIRT